jgi:integrase
MPERIRQPANRKNFTDTNVLWLPPKDHQYFVWDSGRGAASGLAILVNPKTATKTYFVNYAFPGAPKRYYKKIGRVGEVLVEEARAAALAVRRLASQGKDPKADDPNRSYSFETVFQQYIQQEQVGGRKNTSALKTRALVLHNCAEWKPRPVATITYPEVSRLLTGIRDGAHGSKPRAATAARLFAHLRDFFGWCASEQIVGDSPMRNMKAVAKSQSRDRFYSTDELRVIWQAADQLTPVDGSYVKLIMLLALRKDELALAQWDEFDPREEPTLFTVPTARVKMKGASKATKKPVYRVPLAPLAQRLFKGLRRDGETRVFPGLNAEALKSKIVRAGGPSDFMLHTFRHTVATWLENAGRSEWERGLVLNHSGGGSVTGGYSHGYPLELKRTMLTEWADHIEQLVSPAEGVARLR